MKKTVLRAAAIAAVLAMAGSASGCYFFPEEEKLLDPPVLKVEDVTYSTYKAVKKTIINKASATGYCVSELQQDCSFTERDGTLKTIYVRAGDTVKKGDLIAEYNTGDLEYEIRTQELKVQQAQNTYGSSGAENDRLQLEIEKNTLAQLQNEYDTSKLYAPCDGLVSFAERMNAGSKVQAYKVIATIIDPDKIYVKAAVNDDKKFKDFEPRICDLGIRLEVVLEDNTVNIWIDDSNPVDRNKQIAECKQRYSKQISDREVDPFSTSIFFAIGGYYPDMSIGDVLKIVDDFRTDYIEQLQAIIDSENKEDK